MQIGSEPEFLIEGQFLSCKNIRKAAFAEEIPPYFHHRMVWTGCHTLRPGGRQGCVSVPALTVGGCLLPLAALLR